MTISMPVIWLIVAAFFLVLELSTTALVSIWFVPSALVTALAAVWIDSVIVQIIIFVALSAVCLVLFQKFYRNRLKPKSDDVDSNNRLIGKTAKAASEITQIDGKVSVGGVYWHAVTEDGNIEPDEIVEIKSVNGTTLVVTKK